MEPLKGRGEMKRVLIFTTTDPNHPLNQASGDCDGACIIDADGNAICMGSCTWVDSDGHLAFFTWTGQDKGSWRLIGGSGKYAHATGWGGSGACARFARLDRSGSI